MAEPGLVVISGTADHPTPDGAMEMIESERAVWVRVSLWMQFSSDH